MSDTIPVFARRDGEDWLLALKLVPGASRTRIQGILGNRLKIQVQAIAEDGKGPFAKWLNCSRHQVHIDNGFRNSLKTARLTQVNELPNVK